MAGEREGAGERAAAGDRARTGDHHPRRALPKISRRRPVPGGDETCLAGRSLYDVEREVLGGLVRDALRRAEGNKIRAARMLRISRQSLYRRIRRYGIEDGRGGPV